MASTVGKVPRRMSPERKRKIYDAYLASGRQGIDELAKRLGTTKTTIYKVRDEFEGPGKALVPAVFSPSVTEEGELVSGLPDPLLEAMARTALTTLLRDYAECRGQLTRLEGEVTQLRSELETYRRLRPAGS